MSFRDYVKRNKRKLLMQILVFFYFAFVGLAGYGMAVLSEKEKQQAAEPTEEVAVGVSEQKTAEDCIVTWEYVYSYCGHRKMAESPVTKDMAGLTMKELEGKFKNVKILDFHPKFISLQMKIEQYCPDHLILKVADGNLGVYKTALGKDAPYLSSRVAIPYSAIPEQYRQQLQYGEVFNSMEEVQKFITEKLLKQQTAPTE